MPELPEVETVARMLREPLVGRRIEAAWVGWPRAVAPLGPRAFSNRVVGRTIRSVGRRAKYLLLELERDGLPSGWLVGHLRMSGRLQIFPAASDRGPYCRLCLSLTGEQSLHFIDVRKFGRLRHAARPELVLPALGPEPLGEGFSAQWLFQALRGRRRQLKPLLLDQSFLAGLGNIYVDEALFSAGLHPLASSDRISRRRAAALHDSIRSVLTAALAGNGSSFDAFYRTPEGQPGRYQDQFLIYGRDGRPCRRCGRTIVKLAVGQRGTHVCTKCQPKPRLRLSAGDRGRRPVNR